MSTKPFHERLIEFFVRNWERISRAIILAVLLVPVIGGLAGYFVHRHWVESQKLPAVHYGDALSAESETYWFDMASEAIRAVHAQHLPNEKNNRLLRENLQQILRRAERIPGPYARSRAMMQIALAQTKSNIDLLLRETIRQMGDPSSRSVDTPVIAAMKCRILGSAALMYLRLRNETSAELMTADYRRLFFESDLRLEFEDEIIAFLSVIHALRTLNDPSNLDSFFTLAGDAARRIPDRERQGIAMRFLAGQRAAAGMKWEAIDIARIIVIPQEQARAFQLIIAELARPSQPSLDDPVLKALPTSGPWKPIADPPETRRCIESIFALLAKNPDAVQQTAVLQILAGSRLMCDPEIFPLFQETLRQSEALDTAVKAPALALLENPKSNLIRASRGLPPLPVVPDMEDTAADDWSIAEENLRVPIEPIDPETIRNVAEQQVAQSYVSMAKSLLSFGNRLDARLPLEQARLLVDDQTNLYNRLNYLQSIGSLQITAGDIDAARETLMTARQVYSEYLVNREMIRVTVTDVVPAEIAAAQIRARFLSDAMETIRLIPGESQRNSLLEMLAREQIRTDSWDAAAATVAVMSEGRVKTKLAERVREKNDPGPKSADGSSRLAHIVRLIRAEEFDAALRLIDESDASGPLDADRHRMRIVRAYIAIGRPYIGTDTEQQSIRQRMLHKAVALAETIRTRYERAAALEAVATGFAFGPVTKDNLIMLREIIRRAEEAVIAVGDGEPRVGEMFARLSQARVMLVVPEERLRSPWPLVTEEKNRSTVVEVNELLDRALTAATPSNQQAMDPALRASTLTLAVRSAGQIGDADRLADLLPETIRTIRLVPDRDKATSLLITLAGSCARLGESQRARDLFFEAATTTNEINRGIEQAPEQWLLMGRRVRESALDRVVRGQLEAGLPEDALRTIPQITENVVRDRLYRMVVYLYLRNGDALAAEAAAKKIHDMPSRTDVLLDVQFQRRLFETPSQELPSTPDMP